MLGIYVNFAFKRKWALLVIYTFAALAVIFETLAPSALRRLVDGLSEPDATLSIVLASLGLLALYRLASWVSRRIAGFTNMTFSARSMADLDLYGYGYLMDHSYKFFSDNFAGSLVKRLHRLVRSFERFIDEITYRWVPIIVVLIGASIALYRQDEVLLLIFASWFIVFLIFSLWAAKWAVKADIERSEVDSKVGGYVADTVSNAVTVKSFGATRRENEGYSRLVQKFAKLQIRSWNRHEVIYMVQSGLGIIIEIGLLYWGILLWSKGELSVGDLVFIQSYIMIVFSKVSEMARSIRHLFDAYADGKEMVEIIKTPHAIKDRLTATPLAVTKGAITFEKVRFGFGRNNVLKDFSVSIQPKEKIALVGPSGAGKTTITKLLFRFFDVRSGQILIDGQNIAHVTQDSLRKSISMVPQDPILFHRSLRDNIKYGKPDATDEEMIEAAKKAHCHEFITNFPKKYDTFVGERGVKLSGGERQRVAIARAILEDAPILVLDEATSALDSESEQYIQEGLKELMKEKTVIAIAHRLSTIVNMDRILVIEGGRIVAQGSHAELTEKDGTYKNLWNLQAGEFLVDES